MVRVLQVYPQLNNAGTERVIFNLYENIDCTTVQFDFLVERKGELDDTVKSMGGRIYYLFAEKKSDYYSKLVSFFKEHPEYKIVHTHTHARMDVVLKAAKKAGVACRIAHSHNARNDLPKVASFIKGITSIPMEQYATDFFACSRNAAKWLFPHKVKECHILYNGINLDKYLFNESIRKSKRQELGISDECFVMIHVGRFAKQKNHDYLINILEKYNELDSSDWMMLLVGVGPLQEEIRNKVNEAKLNNHVLFLNNRTDVNELLSASDMFVFPSLHEGLGIVVIEAQASGIPCVVSDAVPMEADLEIGLMNTISLKSDYQNWISAINQLKATSELRNGYAESILGSKYNIKKIGKEMEHFYLEHGE